MSLLERGSLVDICANSGHENDPEKTVWTTSKELRIATGMSQEAFADRCGFARSYMSRIERGGSNASLDAIEVLANALSVEPWRLLVSDSSEDSDPELLVPYAADGSCFHPGLASTRDGSFGVGDKTAQKRFGTFSEALSIFVAWRQQNGVGLILAATGVLYLRFGGTS